MYKPRLISSLAALGSSLVLAASLALPASAASRARPQVPAPLAVIAGTLPAAASPSSPARVDVFGEPGEAHLKVGQSVAEPLLASAQVSQGSAFRLAIPDSAAARALLAASDAGTVNARVEAVSAHGVTSWFTVVQAMQPRASTTAPVTRVGQLPTYNLAALRRAAALSGVTVRDLIEGRTSRCIHDCVTCKWKVVKTKYNISTRIDELHVASGVTGTYTYQQKADSTFTVGFQAAGADGWTLDGQSGVTNTTGTGASVPEKGFFSHLWNGRYNYHKDIEYTTSQCPFDGDHKQQAVAWTGSIQPGPAMGERRGGDTCRGALNYVYIDPNGSSNWKQSGKSVFWKVGVSDPMGFSFGDRTGYSNNTKELWKNNNHHPSYLCGPNDKASNHQLFIQWDIVYNYNKK